MPNIDSERAQIVAQLNLDRLKQENISHEASRPLGQVSVSIGIAAAAGSRLGPYNQPRNVPGCQSDHRLARY